MAQRIVEGEQYEAFLIRGGVDGGPVPVAQGLTIPEHDYIGLSYTGSNLTGVVYKASGVSGTTVASLALAYSGTTLLSVTKS
jgi:hypothetical protein